VSLCATAPARESEVILLWIVTVLHVWGGAILLNQRGGFTLSTSPIYIVLVTLYLGQDYEQNGFREKRDTVRFKVE